MATWSERAAAAPCARPSTAAANANLLAAHKGRLRTLFLAAAGTDEDQLRHAANFLSHLSQDEREFLTQALGSVDSDDMVIQWRQAQKNRQFEACDAIFGCLMNQNIDPNECHTQTEEEPWYLERLLYLYVTCRRGGTTRFHLSERVEQYILHRFKVKARTARPPSRRRGLRDTEPLPETWGEFFHGTQTGGEDGDNVDGESVVSATPLPTEPDGAPVSDLACEAIVQMVAARETREQREALGRARATLAAVRDDDDTTLLKACIDALDRRLSLSSQDDAMLPTRDHRRPSTRAAATGDRVFELFGDGHDILSPGALQAILDAPPEGVGATPPGCVDDDPAREAPEDDGLAKANSPDRAHLPVFSRATVRSYQEEERVVSLLIEKAEMPRFKAFFIGANGTAIHSLMAKGVGGDAKAASQVDIDFARDDEPFVRIRAPSAYVTRLAQEVEMRVVAFGSIRV